MRWTNALVVALIAIGVFALVDALRDGKAAAPPETGPAPTTEPRPPPAEALRAAGVTGTLYMTLPVDEGCVLHTLGLPDLESGGALRLDSCRFDVSPTGKIVVGSPCPGRVVQVHRYNRAPRRLKGCAPAWRPDGTLTFVRGGDIRTADGEILVRHVERAARFWFSELRPVTVSAIAWLTDSRVAVVLSGRRPGGGDVLAVFQGGRVLPGVDLSRNAALYVDRPRQRLYVGEPASDLSPAGITVYTRDGEFSREFTAFEANANAYAALDERSYAFARPDNICIYERRDPPPREPFPIACLPFDVVDLAWV
jgi:hypothetical protein